jgi:hypothetical protein
VPENTRTSETRPTYESMVVLQTSATNAPDGSSLSGSSGLPSNVVTGGRACSSGEGNALVSTSSRASRPTFVSAHTGITG